MSKFSEWPQFFIVDCKQFTIETGVLQYLSSFQLSSDSQQAVSSSSLSRMSLRNTDVMKDALFSTADFSWWVLIQDSICHFRFVYSNATVVKELSQCLATEGLSRLGDSKRQRQSRPCTVDSCKTDKSLAGKVPQGTFQGMTLHSRRLLFLPS